MLSNIMGSMATTLTPREFQVLHEIGQGLTNREIASALDLTETAVRATVAVILSKRGLQRRAQAAMHATVSEATGGGVRMSAPRHGSRPSDTLASARPLAG